MKTVQSPDNKERNGTQEKTKCPAVNKVGKKKNALNGVWIAGGVLVLFVVLLLVLRKREKNN